jgi:hypothetical protein
VLIACGWVREWQVSGEVGRADGGRVEGLRAGGDALGLVGDGPGEQLDGEAAQLLHHFIDVGEYGLALEEIAGTLAQDAIAITDQERAGMLALAARMKLEGDLVPHALAACPRPGDQERRSA